MNKTRRWKRWKANLNNWRKSLQTKSALAILITAGVLIEATSAIQYWFAHEGIREEVQHRAEAELRVKNLEIQKVMVAVETATNNYVWDIEHQLDHPDSLPDILHRLVEENSAIVGAAAIFTANYYPQKGRWYEPYAVRRKDKTIGFSQIGGPEHDYLQAEWFHIGLKAGKGHWSEPYFDDTGAKMMLSTYTVPIRDSKGTIVALLGADVSLNWLADVINARHIYPSSYNLMFSRTGQIMVCPVESLILRKSIQEVTSRSIDTSVNHINRQILSGESGQAVLTDNQGVKKYIFFAPVEGETGWSMAVVCADSEIYGSLRRIRFNLVLLLVGGLLLLTFIIYRTARAIKRIQEVNSEKERIGCELKIASSIQMGMLPKTFPSPPERDDVSMYGSLTPAKEVGGDLFDFYIRDEKLFFCIGDVSGKGVPASLVMSVTRSMFRTMSAHEALPERIVTTMSEAMIEINESNMFATLFVGVLDLPTGRLRYCNAGHDAPLIAGSEISLLPVDSNIPVAVMPGWKFTCQETMIKKGTTIFLYTDGLTEAERSDHAQFGIDRVKAVAEQLQGEGEQTPKQLVLRMTDAVQQFVGDADKSDDLTLLAIQYIKQQLDVRLQRNITLPNDAMEVPQLNTFVDSVCEAVNFDPATTMQMNLAIEEAVVNVMNYAYPTGTKGDINIEAQANDVRLKFVITDTGMPFDPTAMKEVDTSLSIEERSIGGLGIHLVRQIMDSINYERINGTNVLTLRKKFNH